MKWLLVLVPLISLIIVSLLIMPMKLEISYVFHNGKSSFDISTSYLFGLIRPEIQPFDNKKEDKQTEKENKQMEDKSKGLRKYSDYRIIIDYIWEKIVIEKFKWETDIGLQEPYYLSILYGFLWAIKSFIISYIMSKKEIDDMAINITPIYNTNKIATRFNCIIKIRMVYIINIWIRILKSYKGGEGNVRSSNRRLNENYNE